MYDGLIVVEYATSDLTAKGVDHAKYVECMALRKLTFLLCCFGESLSIFSGVMFFQQPSPFVDLQNAETISRQADFSRYILVMLLGHSPCRLLMMIARKDSWSLFR